MKHYNKCILKLFLVLGQMHFLCAPFGDLEHFDTDSSLKQRTDNAMNKERRAAWEQKERSSDEIRKQVTSEAEHKNEPEEGWSSRALRFIRRNTTTTPEESLQNLAQTMTPEKFETLSFDQKKQYLEYVVRDYDLSKPLDRQEKMIQDAYAILKEVTNNHGFLDIFDEFLIQKIQNFPKPLSWDKVNTFPLPITTEYISFLTVDQITEILKLYETKDLNILSPDQIKAIKPETLAEVFQGNLFTKAKQFLMKKIKPLPNEFLYNLTQKQVAAILDIDEKMNKSKFGHSHLQDYCSEEQIAFLKVFKDLNLSDKNTTINDLDINDKKILHEKFIEYIKKNNLKIKNFEKGPNLQNSINKYLHLQNDYATYSNGHLFIIDMNQIDPTSR